MLGTVKMEGHETSDWNSYYADTQEAYSSVPVSNMNSGLGSMNTMNTYMSMNTMTTSGNMTSGSFNMSYANTELKPSAPAAASSLGSVPALASVPHPPHSLAHEPQLHLKGDPHYSFNHPFSINNLMSSSEQQHKLDFKAYEQALQYSSYGAAIPGGLPLGGGSMAARGSIEPSALEPSYYQGVYSRPVLNTS
ncbi:hepatocyte nuclear factor 3-alpha [Meleagris gallopavo]|uniref:hepatocyte nuclear factor 3-alpha n=1 Tax=Meleagris gallopavo TaxID=9103 RepID=UPI000549DB0E|nr:hepatocyte nuclear factor 3-alpha [Meleagris gallopavo]